MAAAAAAALPGVSRRALRAGLLKSGLPLDPLVEGVRQEDPGELRRTLTRLAAEYVAAGTERRKAIRALVISARQHAEWASRSRKADEARRAEKAEMVLWMRTWLENPPLFAAWAVLRLRALR